MSERPVANAERAAANNELSRRINAVSFDLEVKQP
jgi:hypothetical protein